MWEKPYLAPYFTFISLSLVFPSLIPRVFVPLIALYVCLPFALVAQSVGEEARTRALRALQTKPNAWGLEAADVADLVVTDAYYSEQSKVTHVWLQQRYRGIPVYGALLGVHLLEGDSLLRGEHRFVAQLPRQITATAPVLRPVQAAETALRDLGWTDFPVPPVQQKRSDKEYILEGGSVSRVPLRVQLCYERLPNGRLALAWSLNVAPYATSDHWHYRIDAVSGAILARHNAVLSCSMPHNGLCGVGVAPSRSLSSPPAPAVFDNVPPVQAPAYRVFPLPIESPTHGQRVLVGVPAHPASPFGWHDTNGMAGAEYTYTRGNNAWAYEDSGNANSGDPARSAPGNASLLFDFPFDPALTPLDNKNAAITNLFYTTNRMHDLSYTYGFDEQAGNYQENNYGKPGFANDPVRAEAIDGAGENNALFEPTADGFPGKMEMYRWSRAGGRLLQVNAPAGPLPGIYSVATTVGWGGAITAVPLTGDVVVATDNTASGPLVCNAVTMDLKGKIALVTRGTCAFREKAYNVQQAGAIACIICNTVESQISMSPGTTGLPVSIPVVMLRKSDCDRLRPFAGNGLNVSLVLPPQSGPDYLDGSFDNGIIVHEYAHGISNRLTGGPNTSICLQNAEQMGEGWSDFFALATTVAPGSKGATPRGIGNYVLREQPGENGIRTYPYSTDMRVNPLTYEFVIDNNTIHNVGEVWAAMLWDVYWAIVDRYGYNADWNDRNSGNGRAMQLVMDGMKIQPCNPGFTDGRNAILRADTLLYGAANSDLLWKAFARRGLGYSARQGSSYVAIDAQAAFDVPPVLDPRVVLEKKAPATAEPGENLTIQLVVTNRTGSPVNELTVEDELPTGLTVLDGSAGYSVQNGKIRWTVPAMTAGQQITLQYRVQTDAALGSVSLFKDAMETSDQWLSSNNSFILQPIVRKVGSYAWKVDASEKATEAFLELNGNAAIEITGQHAPTLRFWHRYEAETGADGGLVEVREVAENSPWQLLERQQGVRKTYPARLQYRTFAIPGLYAYTGNSGGWVQSYFDLSAYKGKTILLRYRFGTDEGHSAAISDGWYIDETEVLDLMRYDGTACMHYNDTTICVKAPEGGTIMGFQVVSATEAQTDELQVGVSPNPATDWIQIVLLPPANMQQNVRIVLSDVHGRVLIEQRQPVWAVGEGLKMDIRALPPGLYSLQIATAQGTFLKKVLKK